MNLLAWAIIVVGVSEVLLTLFFLAVGHAPQRTKATMAINVVSWFFFVVASILVLMGAK